MSRNYNEVEKSPKFQTTTTNRTDIKRPNEEFKQTSRLKNTNNVNTLPQSFAKISKNVKNTRLVTKQVLPPIVSARSNDNDNDNNVHDDEQDFEVIDEGGLPLKLFDGKKQSLAELSEACMSYLWLRRMKEIFLRLADGKDEQGDDPFVEFNMNLAKTDLTTTCDRYIENERVALSKKDTSATLITKNGHRKGSLQNIQYYIKELNDLSTDPSSGDLPSLLRECIESLQELDKNTQGIIDKLRKQPTSSSELDVPTILQLIRSLQMIEGKKEKSELEKKQEWDMKKLYAEVFKMSYRRNPLSTEIEQEELTPKKKGNDLPNFGNAIWWYSCDKANIYYQINTILRLENFELLMSYRYYLSDLCRMIEFMYKKRKDEHGDIAQTFYRAGNVSKKQLEKMNKQQKGQFISLVGFISTTTDMSIAKGYARKQHISKDNERVLFEINIKPQEPCTAFAYIEDISFHPEEKEVLFSMGSTFTVDAVKKPQKSENYHTIQLTASEIDKTLVDDIYTKVENCPPSGRAVLLAQYLIELGEYRAARKYLNSLLTQACDGGILINDHNLAAIYSCLGMTYARQGLHGDAIKAFKQALNTQARLEYSNNNVLADIHNNIGLAYVGLGHMDEAEETLSEALRIQLRELNSSQQHLVAIYSNIGYVHYKKSQFVDAEKAFSEAEKIYKKSSSKIAHDALEQSLTKAEYLTNYGHLLSAHRSVTDAQERYNDALKLYKSILPDSDPKLMQTHINIMLAYAQNEKYMEVTKWYEDLRKEKLIEQQEINMFELSSSVTQASLAFLHEFVGACYAIQEFFDKAIDLWMRAFVFKRKARLEQLLFETKNNISSIVIADQISLINKSYRLAREYYMKSNKSNDDTIKQPSNNFCLSFLYAQLGNRDQAWTYLMKAMPSLDRSNTDILFIAELLSADMFTHRRQYTKAMENFHHALQLIKSPGNQKDRVLEIEIKLARSDCLINSNQNDIAIAELQQLGNSLKSNDADIKRISLKVIVYDTLAQYCLRQKNYELFDNIAIESMTLKLRSFSQYHPSLAINLVLIAERHMHQSHFREALGFYEDALEVQSLNLTDNHPKIRKICYAIGDIYCKIDNLSNAMEKYDVAENKSSNIDEDDILSQEKTNSEESMDLLRARISMHQHLAEYHVRKQVYKEAITERNEIINLLKTELLPSAFEDSDEMIFIEQNIDATKLVICLHQLADCYLHLGDILNGNQEDDYKFALDIYRILFQHDEDLARNKIVLLNQKLSRYYEGLEENDEARESLQNTVDFEQPTIATLYRLASLNVTCNELDQAIENYEKILSDQSIKGEKQLQQIVGDKLNEIKTKVEAQQRRRWLSISGDSDESIANGAEPNLSNNLSRNATNLSATSRHKNVVNPDANVENTDGSSDYRAMAIAYSKLEDSDKSIKYYEKDIKERSKNISDQNIFSKQLEQIEQAAYMYEQQNILILLPKLFHSLVEKIRKTGAFEDSNVMVLADSFFQCALLYNQSSGHLKSVVAYISALGLYISKSLNEIELLTTHVNNLLNSFIESRLKSAEIINVCKQQLSLDDVTEIHFKIAAMYRDNEMDDVEDTDGDGDTSNESRIVALKCYQDLSRIANNVVAKGVCSYNILSLYKNFIYEDDDGKNIVDDMINWLPKFTTFDRSLLVLLALHFLKQYDNNRGTCDIKSNRQLQKIAKTCLDEKLKVNDGDANIGQYLIKLDDLVIAGEYWSSVAKQLECNIPSQILSLVRDPHSTFDQILHITEQPENDIILLYHQLANTYETIGDYYLLDAKSGQITESECLRQAERMYKRAVRLLKQLNADARMISNVDQKRQDVAAQIK